jgi:DNA repair exonuclease SbcCD nuclease subunit
MDCSGLLEGFHAQGDARYHIGVLHADPTKTSSPCCPVTVKEIEHSRLDYLALGHIHKSGFVHFGQTLCAWPGCPMGRGYDETGDKGAYIATLGKEVQVEFVDLDTPRFYDIQTDNPDQALPALGNSDFYRITLTGTEDGTNLESLYHRYSDFPHLTLRDRRTPAARLWDCIHNDTLEGAYFCSLKDTLEGADADTQAIIHLAAQIYFLWLRIVVGKGSKTNNKYSELR